MSNPAVTAVADQTGESSSLKRKRSPTDSLVPHIQPSPTPAPVPAIVAHTPQAPANKVLKPALSINYLARTNKDDLPLPNKEDALPHIYHLLNQYSNVLDRHESLASNLGARPLGPILIKRFERCFETPPKVVASHHKTGANVEDSVHSITWLEVIEFARSHPSQFTLSTFSEGRRVCQFYLPQKQLRVQITEEDFIFINSGRCQELIPPLPIWEDEEKEVSTCDVLEGRLRELTNIADMVAARTRQLCHRLKGRKAAILERRLEGGSGTPAKAISQQMLTATPTLGSQQRSTSEEIAKASGTTRSDLLRHLESLPQNQLVRNETPTFSRKTSEALLPSTNGSLHRHEGPPSTPSNHRQSVSGSASKHNFSRPLAPGLESSQPFRPLCQAHMETLQRGQRVLPPCDRCRRLKMDCVKNLTSCAGCTKKHARCHWRDVSRDEVSALDHLMDKLPATSADSPDSHIDSDDDDDNPLDDLQALAAQARDEREQERARMGSQQQSVVTTPERQTGRDAETPVQPSMHTSVPALPSEITPVRAFPAPSNDMGDTIAVARPSSLGGFRAVNYTPPTINGDHTLGSGNSSTAKPQVEIPQATGLVVSVEIVPSMTTMSTPARTQYHHYIPSIDTSVGKRNLDDYTVYSAGIDTPLSAQDRRRPSLTFSAFSEPSPGSLPTTPGYRIGCHSTESTPLFYPDHNALRMMNCIKTEPNTVRPSRQVGLTHFELLPGEDNSFSMPVPMSSCPSFEGYQTAPVTTAESWHAMAEGPVPQLAPSALFRTPSVNTSSSFESEHLKMYSDNLQHQQQHQLHEAQASCGAEQFDTQQYLSPQQLVSPAAMQEHDIMYTHGLTTPVEHQPLPPSTFDTYSFSSAWSQGDTSSPMDDYNLVGEGFVRPKDEHHMHGMSVNRSFGSHMGVSPRRRLKKSMQKRGRAGSLQYVTNPYDVDLVIDTKGVEYKTETGWYEKKNVSPETKRWKCSVPGCNSLSARKEHLRRHELSHQIEKQFHCKLPKCGRAITRSDNLIQHLMTHARPTKAGKRNNHHSRKRIEEMVIETMKDKKLADRTITNLRKAIEREQHKWSCTETDVDWTKSDIDDETANALQYDS